MTAISPATALEATMLICFGFSWPIANLRMLRLRRAEGRGLVPTSLTLLGYSAGMAAKILCACSGAGLAPIFWLYLLNAASVALNLALQRHYGRVAEATADQRKPPATRMRSPVTQRDASEARNTATSAMSSG